MTTHQTFLLFVFRSPGRIVEAFIQDFSALGEAGNLHVIIQNTGSYTADYEVTVKTLIIGP